MIYTFSKVGFFLVTNHLTYLRDFLPSAGGNCSIVVRGAPASGRPTYVGFSQRGTRCASLSRQAGLSNTGRGDIAVVIAACMGCVEH
jgi:hypothetical protein